MTDIIYQEANSAQASTVTPTTAPITLHPVMGAVVQSVYNDPTIPPENAATVAANVLNGIAQYAPTVLALTRSSAQTQAWAAVGIGVLSSIISAFFPHPKLTQG